MIYGHGVYRYDPLSMAAQGISQDAVTLVLGIPLLLVSLHLYRQRRLRGQLLLTGTLAYFLYTYTSLAFGAAFNPLFLALRNVVLAEPVCFHHRHAVGGCARAARALYGEAAASRDFHLHVRGRRIPVAGMAGPHRARNERRHTRWVTNEHDVVHPGPGSGVDRALDGAVGRLIAAPSIAWVSAGVGCVDQVHDHGASR